MTVINKSAVVPYTTTQMYDLINDVEQYSQFIPYCVNSRVIDRSEDEIHASLSFAAAGIRKSFSTLNRLQPDKMVEMRLVNGPFKTLEGFWSFEAVDSRLYSPSPQSTLLGIPSADPLELLETRSDPAICPTARSICRVTLNLEFEFSTAVLKMLFGSVFTQAVAMLVGAFHKRAEQVYK